MRGDDRERCRDAGLHFHAARFLIAERAILETELVRPGRQHDLIAIVQPQRARAFGDRELEGRKHFEPAGVDRFGQRWQPSSALTVTVRLTEPALLSSTTLCVPSARSSSVSGVTPRDTLSMSTRAPAGSDVTCSRPVVLGVQSMSSVARPPWGTTMSMVRVFPRYLKSTRCVPAGSVVVSGVSPIG